MSRYLRAPDSAVFAFGAAPSSASPATSVSALQSELSQLLARIQTQIATLKFWEGDKERDLKNLASITKHASDRVNALAPAAKGGDVDALKKVEGVARPVLTGMPALLKEIDNRLYENLQKTLDDIQNDIDHLATGVAAAISRTLRSGVSGAFKGSPILTVAVLGLGGYLVWRKLK
jgi:uncharacterized protein YukE